MYFCFVLGVWFVLYYFLFNFVAVSLAFSVFFQGIGYGREIGANLFFVL